MALQSCRECGQSVSTRARTCPHCGIDHPTPEQVEEILSRQSATSGERLIYPNRQILIPEFIGLASLLFPGLGQFLYGQTKKGVAAFAGSLVLVVMTGGLAALFVWPAVAWDAYRVATVMDEGQPVGEWEWFPAMKS